MNTLVTGVAGFIGSNLAERLLTAGHSVLGVDCFTDYYPRETKERNLTTLHKHSRFRFLETEITTADWKRLLVDVNQVFHLAAQAGVRRSWGTDFSIYTACNIDATQVLLEACVNTPIDRFVYASSSSVYGDEAPIPMSENVRVRPVSPYGVTKLAAEHLASLYWINHQVPTVSLRYFTVYGPRQRPDMAFHRFLRAIQREQPITLYGDGEQTRDFTFIDDIVSATITAASQGHPGNVYNIGGGSRVSVNQVIQLMAAQIGNIPIINAEAPQKGDMRDTYADTTLAQSDLNFVPSIGLEDGIRAEYEWLRTEPELGS